MTPVKRGTLLNSLGLTGCAGAFGEERKQALGIARAAAGMYGAEIVPEPLPHNAMRVGPGTDAVVWRLCEPHPAEL